MADAEALADRLRARVGTGGAALLSAAMARAYTEQIDPEGVLRHCDAVRHEPSPFSRPSSRPAPLWGVAPQLAGRFDEAEAAARRAIEAGERHAAPFAVLTGRSVLCLCALAAGRGRDAAAMAAENAERGPPTTGPSSSR